MEGSRIYLGMSRASNRKNPSHTTRVARAASAANTTVNSKGVLHDPFIVMHAQINGAPARIYFVRTESGLEFAGWEEQKGVDDVMLNRAMLPIPLFSTPRYLEQSVLAFGTPAGESALEHRDLATEDELVAERFASLIIAQLRMGPNALPGGGALRSVNALMFNSYYTDTREPISNEQWENILHMALGLAVRYTPIFGDRGLRSATSIQDDACQVLGLDLPTFYAWENHFEIDVVAEQVFAGHEISEEDPLLPQAVKRLTSMLDAQIELMASRALGVLHTDMGASRRDEINLHWRTAMISALPNANDKVDCTRELIEELLKNGKRNLAGRGLALIVSNSELNKTSLSDDSLLPRWSEAEVASLISALMKSNMWDIVSHRSFRQHLTPEENKAINQLVYSANYTEAVEQLSRIDVTKVSPEDFWEAVDRTGLGDILETDAFTRMALHN
ncbi:MAG: hypothetical protein ABH871_04265 [Pseudomonadota bacterium]